MTIGTGDYLVLEHSMQTHQHSSAIVVMTRDAVDHSVAASYSGADVNTLNEEGNEIISDTNHVYAALEALRVTSSGLQPTASHFDRSAWYRRGERRGPGNKLHPAVDNGNAFEAMEAMYDDPPIAAMASPSTPAKPPYGDETVIALDNRTDWEKMGEWEKYSAFMKQNAIYHSVTTLFGTAVGSVNTAYRSLWNHPGARTADGVLAALEAGWALHDAFRRLGGLKADDSLGYKAKAFIVIGALAVGVVAGFDPAPGLPKRIYALVKSTFEATFPALTTKFSVKESDWTTLLTDFSISSSESFSKAELKHFLKKGVLLSWIQSKPDYLKGMIETIVDSIVDSGAALLTTPAAKAISRYLWGAEYAFSEQHAVQPSRETLTLGYHAFPPSFYNAMTKQGYGAIALWITNVMNVSALGIPAPSRPVDPSSVVVPAPKLVPIPVSIRIPGSIISSVAEGGVDMLKAKTAIDSPELNFDAFDHPSPLTRALSSAKPHALFRRIKNRLWVAENIPESGVNDFGFEVSVQA
ncbi:hypothetical protein JOE11_000129 [Robbsia andropogonis]|uniref:hypothetical protein n=1 Tax=Robbsia andropogonis TaxID=28092 RepID=UPI003D1A81A9